MSLIRAPFFPDHPLFSSGGVGRYPHLQLVPRIAGSGATTIPCIPLILLFSCCTNVGDLFGSPWWSPLRTFCYYISSMPITLLHASDSVQHCSSVLRHFIWHLHGAEHAHRRKPLAGQSWRLCPLNSPLPFLEAPQPCPSCLGRRVCRSTRGFESIEVPEQAIYGYATVTTCRQGQGK